MTTELQIVFSESDFKTLATYFALTNKMVRDKMDAIAIQSNPDINEMLDGVAIMIATDKAAKTLSTIIDTQITPFHKSKET